MACTPTLASRLRHKIVIQSRTETRGTTGEVVETWGTYLVARASVEPLIGREYFQAMQEQSESKVKFRLRYSGLVDAVNSRGYRILWKSNIYDIESKINVFERNKEILIMATLHNE